MLHDSGSVPAATAVGTLLAPVVACLRGDDDGFSVLLDAACEDGLAPSALAAAPAIARVYLRLAPPPDGAETIVHTYPRAAHARFDDAEVVTLGTECLHVARVPAAVRSIADAMFVQEALERGDRRALVGAVASCWWCALRSAQLRGSDPVEEAAAVCRYVARVA
jgi:hypothetical protein